MKITKNNLNEVMFENEDARLLILDVVSHTQANLYYYHDMEITVQLALSVWKQTVEAEENERFFLLTFPAFSVKKGNLCQSM